jgi:hypothetical protein
MRRRTVLRGVSSAALAGLAGCLGAGDPGAPDDGTDSPTETPSPPTSPSTTPGGTVRDTSFDLVDAGSGMQVDDASVAFGDPVTVTGTIWGADGCQTAELGDVTLADGTLTVVVRTTEREFDGTPACTQAIVELDYEATVTVDGAGPATIVVVHERDGERTEVARAER